MIGSAGLAGALSAGPLGNEGLEGLRHKPVAEVAREFEALLLAQMIGAMRKTVGESGLLSASPERKVLDGFFDMELARSLVDQVDLGLARQLTREVAGAAGDAPTAATQAATQAAASWWPTPGDDAELLPPVAARVSSAYGERVDPLTGELDFHGGLDLAAPAGTPVRAAAAGTVAFSGERGAAGNVVELRHRDGTSTSYAHLQSTKVAVGDVVAAGQVLGAVGSSGRSTGPHLHFVVERAGDPVDPAPLIGRARG